MKMDNIIDRDNLQDSYIKELIDCMDFKTMYQFCYDTINEDLNNYSMTELIEEVENYNPELLDGNKNYIVLSNSN